MASAAPWVEAWPSIQAAAFNGWMCRPTVEESARVELSPNSLPMFQQLSSNVIGSPHLPVEASQVLEGSIDKCSSSHQSIDRPYSIYELFVTQRF